MAPRGRLGAVLAPRALLLWTSVLLGCLIHLVVSEYGPKDAVVVLTEKNFEAEVLNSPDYWLVEFYAPWCGHCQKLEPEYKAAAKKLKNNARLGVVDATENQQLAQKYKVQGYPTIKEFGAKKKRPRDYQGGRSRDEIVQYVLNSDEAQKLGVSSGSVSTLTFADVHAFLTTKDIPSAIFFGSPKKNSKKSGGKPPSWLSKVADQFTTGKKKKMPTVQIGFVPGSDDKIAKHFGLDDNQLPTVLFVYPSSLKYVAIDASTSLSQATATAFIEKTLSTDATDTETLASVPLFPSPEVAKKKPKVALQTLTADHVRACVTATSKKMCVLVAGSGEDSADEAVRSLAKKYRRDPFSFFSSGSDTAAFQAAKAFVGTDDDVEVLVLKPGRKVKYSVLLRSREEASSLDEYLDRLLDGSSSFTVAPRGLRELEALLKGEATQQDEEAVHEEL